MQIGTAIEEYLTTLRVERGLAANTVRAYRRDLTEYAGFLEAAGKQAVTEATADDVAGFLSHLHSRGLAASTVGRKLAAVRGLHRFLVAEEVVADDPTAATDVPRRPQSLPKALTVDEVTAIIEAPDPATPLGARDRALLEFLYASAARVSEVVALDLLDVDLDGATALVTGKGDRQRLVPLGRHALAALRTYLPARMALKGDRPDPGALFITARGTRMRRQSVWLTVKRHAVHAGVVADRISPHVLRHSAATHMVEGGADLRTVQEILGHASISTTQIYTRVSPRHLLEVYVASHPRST
jgi:integrase/recombinase XerD